ncbi:MAG: hypothetical protein KAX31_03810, partial [Thermoplasmata archaeon]|nr:hypothetical protein [Thermoplasmata archaeon]
MVLRRMTNGYLILSRGKLIVLAIGMMLILPVLTGAAPEGHDLHMQDADRQVTVKMGDNLYRAWIEGEIHQTCIIFANSNDGGETWSRSERVTDAEHVPMDLQMLASADTVHLIWTDLASRQLCTGYGRLADDNWELESFEGHEAGMDAQGRDVVIVTRLDEGLGLYVSEDAGETFDTRTVAGELRCRQPAVALHRGRSFVAFGGGVRDPGTGALAEPGIYLLEDRPLRVSDTREPVRVVELDVGEAGVRIAWTEESLSSFDRYEVEGNLGRFSEARLVSSESKPDAEAQESKPSPRLPPKKWTYIGYIDGDNNLEGVAIEDLNEMEMVGSSADMNIIALVDRWSNGDTRAYYVEYDTTAS